MLNYRINSGFHDVHNEEQWKEVQMGLSLEAKCESFATNPKMQDSDLDMPE